MTDTDTMHTIELHLAEAQAMALAQFVKRVGWSEFRANAVDDDEAREIRAGIDSLQRALAEAGFDVVVQNWRMVAAAPGLSADQKAAVLADIEKLAKSAGWQKALADKGWADTYLAGADFEAQLAKEIAATTAILKDVGLVQCHPDRSKDAAPMGRRSS